jgi:hypothetical protein
MTKVTLRAVIPVAQYANMQPEIEAEAETYDEAMALAETRMAQFWNKYVEGDKKLPTTAGQRITAFVGGQIDYDPVAHVYTWNGETYLSGSKYAAQFDKPFDKQAIAGKMAAKHNVDGESIVRMWELKARASREFGTALHSALQLYGQYDGLAKALEKETHLHDHPVLKKAVESFYAGRENEKAEYEIFVVDHEAKRVGQIDRLLITDEKKCRIQDYKTNAVMTPDKLKVYFEQTKFYGGIMEAAGWIVEGYDIFAWDGEWTIHNKENI